MRHIFTVLAIILCIHATAQEVEVPTITSVRVDYITGLPVVQWTVSNPDDIDGYIIKRLIVDGDGVVANTYNNVAVIDGGRVFSYLDTSTAYGTSARPEDRSEVYRVSAFRKSGDRIYYSLMSPEAATLTASGFYDFCTESFAISCDSSISADAYVLRDCTSGGALSKGQSPEIKYHFADYQPVRRLAVDAVLVDGTIVGSPVIEIEATGNISPGVLAISDITLDDRGQGLDIQYLYSGSPSVSRFAIIRELGGAADTVLVVPVPVGDFRDCDIGADCSQLYSYKIAVYNSCFQLIAESEAVSNIVLAAQNSVMAVELDWNVPEFYGRTIQSASLMMSVDGGDFQELYSTAGSEHGFRHVLAEMITDDVQLSGKFRYQLRYLFTDGGVAKSNIVTVMQSPVIRVPNALNPMSEIEENRFFRPVVGFVSDYQLIIYNKHGAPIFRTFDMAEGWDGRDRRSHLCEPGAYIFVISCRQADGSQVEKKGWVNLVY